MPHYIFGIFAALAAILFWGLGDFYIQRSVRKVGVWESLFYIGLIGGIFLFPFVVQDLGEVFASPVKLLLLVGTGVVSFCAALFDLEALRKGKIALIEPVLGLELPFVVFFSVVFHGDRLSLLESIFIGLTFLGILGAVLVPQKSFFKKMILEKGAIYGLLGAAIAGLVAFLTGISSQETSPFLAIWFTDVVFTFFCFLYLWYKGDLQKLPQHFKKNYKIIFAESIFDDLAWISFAFTTLYFSISIATTITESYIVFSVLLGIFVNKEKVKYRQMLGIGLTIVSIVFLSTVTAY